VLGAITAVTRELVTVCHTTVVNKETMCELPQKESALGLVGAITLVLDNARYQRNELVKAKALSLGIELLFPPSYSPNLNLIERLCNGHKWIHSTGEDPVTGQTFPLYNPRQDTWSDHCEWSTDRKLLAAFGLFSELASA
jgi:transposase